MADKLGLGREIHELKLGTSFTNPKELGFHTLRYDFKPASVEGKKRATVDIGTNSQVTVTVPPNTVFQGSSKPYQKECIVIIDRDTGEIRLEKLSCNLQVKKTRSENRKINPMMPTCDPLVAVCQKMKKSTSGSNKGSSSSHSVNNHSNKSKPMKTTGQNKSRSQFLGPTLSTNLLKHSPLQASPNRKSPNPATFSPNRPSANASLPKLGGFDDLFPSSDNNKDRTYPYSSNSRDNTSRGSSGGMGGAGAGGGGADFRMRTNKVETKSPIVNTNNMVNEGVGLLSDSSSCSSSSCESSDSSDSEGPPPKPRETNLPNGNSNDWSENVLNDDLHLSESGSDSD